MTSFLHDLPKEPNIYDKIAAHGWTWIETEAGLFKIYDSAGHLSGVGLTIDKAFIDAIERKGKQS